MKTHPLMPALRWSVLGLFLVALTSFAGMAPASAQDKPGPDIEGAKAFITDLADKTITLLQSDMSNDDKQAGFAELLEDGVNTDYVSRFVLGRNWNTASADQREQFRSLFKEYLLANLTERLAGQYDNQSFTVKNAVPAGTKDVLVRSEIQQANGQPLAIEWRVRQFGDKWQIIDIAAEGLSLAITQREEYGAVVQRKGMDGLLSALSEQVARMKSGEPEAPLTDSSGA